MFLQIGFLHQIGSQKKIVEKHCFNTELRWQSGLITLVLRWKTAATSKPVYVYLWLLRAWVWIPSVVIFSDNQKRIQIVTNAFCFFKSYRCIWAFMLLDQLASLSDNSSMLQKSASFCLKKLNHISTLKPILIKSYTDPVNSVIIN